MAAEPNSFVVLFPVTWDSDNIEYIEQLHSDRWNESVSIGLTSTAPGTEAHVEISGDSSSDYHPETILTIDAPLENLQDFTNSGKEPVKPGDAALIEQHTAIWRFTIEQDTDAPDTAPHAGCKHAATHTARLMATLTEAGSAGAFVPAIQQLHGSEFVRSQASQLPPPDVDAANPQGVAQTLVNLFVAAWDDTVSSEDADTSDDEQPWMMTRGLTSFGLPELETPVDSGFNAAYFRLLDVASGMITQQGPYPVGANLQLGPESCTLREGPRGPEDTVVPTSGAFGVFSILPDS